MTEALLSIATEETFALTAWLTGDHRGPCGRI